MDLNKVKKVLGDFAKNMTDEELIEFISSSRRLVKLVISHHERTKEKEIS